MRKAPHALFLFWLCALGFPATAQTCHFGQGETGLDADMKPLRNQPTCQGAYALYRKCLWGSSADGPRADLVMAKCKAVFQGKLTNAQQVVLAEKLDLCKLEYQGMDGTLWLSEASSCSTSVFVGFATDPARASQPIPRASFDCSRAQTPLEQTVCRDTELGHYDLLMAGAYKSFLGELKGDDKSKLIQNQRAWNAATPRACSLATTGDARESLVCLQKRYRERMEALNGCAAGADVGCLESAGSDH